MTGRNGDIEGRNLPTTGRERIHSLDLLRGLARLGRGGVPPREAASLWLGAAGGV